MERPKQLRSAAMIAVVAVVLLTALGMKAQGPQPAPDAQTPQTQDPPGRVARLNYIDGSVSFQPAGGSDWVDATLNRPLVTGDNLWTDENSRAELHVGSTALRLGEKTGITLLEVSDHAVQIRLAMGSLIVNVRRIDAEDAYEIDTPNVAFVVTQPGDYRVDVSPDDYRTDVTVWRGRGEVTGGGSTYTIVADQCATFKGSDRLDYDISQTPGEDALGAWASERDRHEDDSDSAEYVSDNMTGYEDLGSYGDWSYVAEYGYVWRPVGLVPGWAPYRFGRWIWVAPWGWTWVADEPWGFAPYHYGRWAFAGNTWVWVPGSRVVRPVYAPALVGWVGGPPSNRSVGWFPLAPGEVFVPAYKVSSVYVNRVNTTNTSVTEARVSSIYNTVITSRNTGTSSFTYANRGVEGGVTVVSHDTFVNALPVARNVVSVSSKQIASSSTIPAIEPSTVSRLGAGASTHQPPRAVVSRAVVALRTPTSAPQAADQSQALTQRSQQASSRPSSSQPLVRQLAPGQPVAPTQVKHSLKSDPAFSSFEPGSSSSAEQVKPHVWEEQGTPQPEPTTQQQPETRKASSAQRRAHTTARSTAPAPAKPAPQPNEKEEEPKYSSWHPQKSPTNSQPQSVSHSATQSHSSSSSSPPPPKK
jgi:hypothetical protein